MVDLGLETDNPKSILKMFVKSGMNENNLYEKNINYRMVEKVVIGQSSSINKMSIGLLDKGTFLRNSETY